MLYHEAERESNIRKVSGHKDDPVFIEDAQHVVATIDSLEKKNNVHLVVMESFLDPQLFGGGTAFFTALFVALSPNLIFLSGFARYNSINIW